MSAPVTGGDPFPLGPGELLVGAAATPIDVSCLINNAVIAMEKDEGDSTTKLCGTVVPGDVAYTYTLTGNVDIDIALETGFWALTQTQAGMQTDFTYTPNTDAGTVATGVLVLDPLPFGGDEAGTTMTADFEFTIVGKPTYTFAGGAVVEGSTQAHKVRAERIPPPEPETKPTGKGKAKADA